MSTPDKPPQPGELPPRTREFLELMTGPLHPPVTTCTCHREGGSHELCCGHPDGIDPDCPLHGEGAE